jgi:hypothetical protein
MEEDHLGIKEGLKRTTIISLPPLIGRSGGIPLKLTSETMSLTTKILWAGHSPIATPTHEGQHTSVKMHTFVLSME